MPHTKSRLDCVRVMDERVHHEDGTWSGEYYYEWSCGCRVYIPVFKDGSLGDSHREECCREHSAEMVESTEGVFAAAKTAAS